MSLVDFLLARIAEDESDPDRVLAECAAKRRIVEAHHWEEEWENGVRFTSDCADCWQSPPCHTLRILATVYSDHADYRPEWKP